MCVCYTLVLVSSASVEYLRWKPVWGGRVLFPPWGAFDFREDCGSIVMALWGVTRGKWKTVLLSCCHSGRSVTWEIPAWTSAPRPAF